MKKITNEEAYKAYCNCVIGQNADYVNKNHLIVKAYFEQQQKKDKLLDLKNRDNSCPLYNTCSSLGWISEECSINCYRETFGIKALEEEIK